MRISPQQAVCIGPITGPGLTDQWHMGAADMGVMWQSGDTTFHAFGDNFQSITSRTPPDGGPTGPDWKPNALGRSTNVNFQNGVPFDSFLIDPHGNRKAFIPPNPTLDDGLVAMAGIHVPYPGRPAGIDVVSYSAPALGHTDQSQTRTSGTGYSVDGGTTWYKGSALWPNNSTWSDPFQQAAFAWDGGQWVYKFTTQSARAGDIHLSRVTPAGILDKSQYQYYVGNTIWTNDPTQVGILIPGPAGEMSARYDDLLGVWMILYHDDPAGATVFRYAASPTGPWSAELPILHDNVMNVYAPEIHPQSSGTGLWFCASQWSDYQTYLFYSNLNVSCP